MAQSLNSDLLRYADHGWLKSIERGLRLAQMSRRALVVLFGIHVAISIAGLLLFEAETDGALERAIEVVRKILGSLMIVAGIATAAGLWIAFEVEPREADRNPARGMIVRWLSGLGLPALGIWWAFGLAHKSAILNTRQIGAMMVCFVIVLLHLLILLTRARELESRTAAASRTERLQTLAGHSRLVGIAAVIIILICALGPMRWIDAGQWIPPNRRGMSFAFFATACAWTFVTGVLSTTRNHVHAEVLARRA